MIPIVDTHQHLWDLEQFQLPWVDDMPALKKSFVSSDYQMATQNANVTKSIYMEVDVKPEQQVAEAHAIIELCQRDDNPTCGAVISGRPASLDFADYITPLAKNPYIKGVRQVLHVPEAEAGLCLTLSFVQSVKLLGELGLSFDLCMRPSELQDGAKLAAQCPETRFIVDHCGNADPNVISGSLDPGTTNPGDPFWHARQQWMDDIATLVQLENVICKISGIVVRATPGEWTHEDLAPTINHCLDSFGPDRVVFGGDWPVCTLVASYQEWADALRAVIAARSEEEQRKLLHDNAPCNFTN